MSMIRILKTSITDLDTDAVVNAANTGLRAGGGVCGAVFRAAGHDRLREACDKIGHCDTGRAVITPGFALGARYIIHAVGPVWSGGGNGEAELLYGAYISALELAEKHGCASVGFPLISAGIYGYPVEGAWSRAIKACRDFLDRRPDSFFDIVFAVLDDRILDIGKKTLANEGASKYKLVERDDWKTNPMPRETSTFILRRPFSPLQMAVLRKGHIPLEMEDKWFWFMEGDTLFAHRSWTGNMIYRVDFKPNDEHVVTVNRDPEQFACDDEAEIAQRLNDLLCVWSREPYDHYREWLREIAKALEKDGKKPEKTSG